MSEQFSIMIGNRSRFDAGDPGGYWLDMPATKEQLHEAMRDAFIFPSHFEGLGIAAIEAQTCGPVSYTHLI